MVIKRPRHPGQRQVGAGGAAATGAAGTGCCPPIAKNGLPMAATNAGLAATIAGLSIMNGLAWSIGLGTMAAPDDATASQLAIWVAMAVAAGLTAAGAEGAPDGAWGAAAGFWSPSLPAEAVAAGGAAAPVPAAPPAGGAIPLRAAKSMASSPSFFCFNWALARVKKTTLRCSSSTRTFFRRRLSRAALRLDSRRALRFCSSSTAVLGFLADGADAVAAATS
ncbi:hypothetical protein ACHAXT_010573 [Thalassiosira profunda]